MTQPAILDAADVPAADGCNISTLGPAPAEPNKNEKE